MKYLLLILVLASVSACSHKGKSTQNPHKAHKMKMMKLMDTNKDGTISQDEYTAAMHARFDKIDSNKDGKLSKNEKMSWIKSKKHSCSGSSKSSCKSCS